MNYFSFSSLTNAIAFFVLFLVVTLHNPKSNLNRSFGYFCLSVIWWSTSYLFWQLSSDHTTALFWCKSVILGACFIPTTFLHFSLRLIDEFSKYKKALFLTYVFSIIFGALCYTPLLVLDVRQYLFFPFWLSPGKAYHFLILFFVITISYALLRAFRKFQTLKGAKRNQLKYVFLGIFIGFMGGVTNFPLSYNIPLPPFGNILVSLMGIFIAYAIVKHQLMDIQVVFKKSVVYSVSIATISLLYMVGILILEKLAQFLLGYHSIFVSIFTAFVLGLFFIPIQQEIQRIMDRYFFKGSTAEIANQNEQLRQELIQAEKYKTLTTLATGIAHEVKNPLTAIKTFTEYLPKRMNDEKFLKNFSKIVGNEVGRIDDLVHQLLDYGKPAPLTVKRTNINKLIQEILEVLNNNFLKRKIRIQKYLARKSPSLDVDRNQIKQALLNILMNAMDAMPKGGTLTIETATSDTGYFVIKITDTGEGIPKEQLSQIFDPFFSNKDNGTGLGLSITQTLIENHKGIIQIQSKVGLGTTVEIDLPF